MITYLQEEVVSKDERKIRIFVTSAGHVGFKGFEA